MDLTMSFDCWIGNQFMTQIESLDLSIRMIIHIKKEKRKYLLHQSVNLLPNFDIMWNKQYIVTSYPQMALLTLFTFPVKKYQNETEKLLKHHQVF